MLTRRQVLTGAAAATGAALLPSSSWAASSAAQTGPASSWGGSTSAPFLAGVASGDPLPTSVVLWTRLITDNGLPNRPIEVSWQVARDESFRHVVRHGVAVAQPKLAHSVHVDPRGLQPGHEYFYRFKALGHLSPVGRTRTAASARDRLGSLRFGIVNCQDFQNGYWPAYDGLAAEDLDLVVHLGDYIYEYDPHSAFPDRRHTTPATPGLDQF
jgi:alkaline phosphatase D